MASGGLCSLGANYGPPKDCRIREIDLHDALRDLREAVAARQAAEERIEEWRASREPPRTIL